jgi:hypothetical protein
LTAASFANAAAYQGLLQFIRKSERIARKLYGAEPINRLRRSQLDAALLLLATSRELAGTSERLLGDRPFVFKHLIARFAISETKIIEECWG